MDSQCGTVSVFLHMELFFLVAKAAMIKWDRIHAAFPFLTRLDERSLLVSGAIFATLQ